MTPKKRSDNYKRFEYYLRQCDMCDEFFHAQTKKSRLCDKCKKYPTKKK